MPLLLPGVCQHGHLPESWVLPHGINRAGWDLGFQLCFPNRSCENTHRTTGRAPGVTKTLSQTAHPFPEHSPGCSQSCSLLELGEVRNPFPFTLWDGMGCPTRSSPHPTPVCSPPHQMDAALLELWTALLPCLSVPEMCYL